MFFDMFTRKDINKGVEEWKETNGAILLDVRTKQEYNDGHIDGSVNIPLDNIDNIDKKIPNRNTPIFVHCLSGARSSSAVRLLNSIGYTNVKDIGGISTYRGKTV